jgi:isoleucyl-tRNA synthetase
MDANEREVAILKFWAENKIFQKSLEKPAPRGEFVFYEGPPTANGRPGIHHLAARSYKDIIPRYKTMRGYHVRRKAGWDTHGLPVELQVEKALGFKSKKEIEAYGIAAFNQKCRESVWEYKAEWEKFTERIGFWLDQEHSYVTYHNDYIETLWQVFKKVEERGLLYRDYKVVPWCPRCGTALSSHELAQGYKEVSDTAVYVKFKVVADQKLFQVLGKNPQTVQKSPVGPVYLLAWTTTPWTLPGNVALAVGEDVEYVAVKVGDETLILAKQLAESAGFSNRADWLSAEADPKERGRKILGRDLLGLKYEPLFDFPALQNDKSHQVYAADFVTTTEGTGIVHTAVMYGADDFELGTKLGLPKSHLVGEDGRFIAGTPWAGKKVTEVGTEIITDLEARDLLFKQEKYIHTYPFCWRCQTPLIYYARDSWYIRMSELRSELVKENEKINWTPAHIKEGRFGEWLREIKDWAISRERYWGTPLPIWENADRSKRLVVGSLEELKGLVKKSGNQYFVMRHGEADHNVKNILSSKSDNPHHLTPKGEAAVARAVAGLAGSDIDLIIASPFVRTRETAAIAQKALGLKSEQLLTDERLRELQVGSFEGQSAAVAYAGQPGVETHAQVRCRVKELIYELENQYQNKKILLVTHDSPARELADTADSFELAELRPIDFVPVPHNENYELDFHRPFIDEIVLVKDGVEYKRVPEVADVWFDSGAMPFAQDHYPFATEKIAYPADYIAEALDQTRGWFYTLLAVGLLMGRGAPYKNVVCLGLLLDKQGKKMSKSVGNVVDPWEMMGKYGADALRLWFYGVNQPGEAKRFDEETVKELGRKPLTLLLNVLAFYKLYPAKAAPAGESKNILDRWLAVRLSEVTALVGEHLDNYRVFEAVRLVGDLIDDLSTWYLRRSRDRLRTGEAGAAAVLRTALNQIARLLAPFAPFAAETVYQAVKLEGEPESVHLAEWPASGRVEERLLGEMMEVRRVVSLGLEARAKGGFKIRQPLASIKIKTQISVEYFDLICDELNVKTFSVDGGLVTDVELDTNLTPELINEGQWRELVRAIQDERKKKGLAPGQLARAEVAVSPKFKSYLESNLADLKQTTALSELKLTDDVVDDLPFGRINLGE